MDNFITSMKFNKTLIVGLMTSGVFFLSGCGEKVITADLLKDDINTLKKILKECMNGYRPKDSQQCQAAQTAWGYVQLEEAKKKF